ncbi:MAG: ABC transporter ATP-binding protein [Acidimicrobiia bacterium]|nr:ABC transporter ATP-binding protein [Acidimicrobiia bacterium]
MFLRQIARARTALNDVAPYLGSARRLLVPLVVLTALSGFAQAGVLVIVAAIAVSLTDTSTTIDVSLWGSELAISLRGSLLTAAGCLVVMVALQLLAAAMAARMGTTALATARREIFTDFLAASWEIQARERRGNLQDLLSTHISKVSAGVSHLTQFLVAFTNLSILLLAAVVLDPIPALAVMGGMGLLMVVLRPITTRARRLATEHASANLEFTTTLTEMVGLAREIRIYNAIPAVREGVNELQEGVADQQRRLGFAARSVQILYQGAALTIVVAGLAVISVLDVGNLASLGAMVLLLLRAISYGQQTQSSLHHLSEMKPYLTMVRATQDRYASHRYGSGATLVDDIGELRLDAASYRYDDDEDEMALADIDILVPAGAMIGVVGPSGSGKSTLVQLLLRLRPPTAGRYLVNGADARDLDATSWFDHVAFVPQDPLLIDGTVADNIRFFRPGLSDADLERAARLAHLHEEITSWPNGYQTRLGGQTSGISGGQAQRLCIARALAVHPGLLVLDEPTSALDLHSESLIQETLEELAGTTTMVIIAHRISTIQRCDHIAVLEGGRLTSYDTPGALAENDRFFRDALDLSATASAGLPRGEA